MFPTTIRHSGRSGGHGMGPYTVKGPWDLVLGLGLSLPDISGQFRKLIQRIDWFRKLIQKIDWFRILILMTDSEYWFWWLIPMIDSDDWFWWLILMTDSDDWFWWLILMIDYWIWHAKTYLGHSWSNLTKPLLFWGNLLDVLATYWRTQPLIREWNLI
jgi:hypothetical protein